jgi:GAF domain-containing protein
MSDSSDHDKLRRVLDLERALASEPDTERALWLVLEEARVITEARYGALGVLDRERLELERFLASGVEEAVRQEIGTLPRGRGVLGVLIVDPRPLRLIDVSQHPNSYGFPAGHPSMRSFLGAPIMIGGEAAGSLYVTYCTHIGRSRASVSSRLSVKLPYAIASSPACATCMSWL